MKLKRVLFVFLILFFASFSFSFSATPSKVLILPFEVNAPQDLQYLKKAIPEMLTSRLFSPDKIQVIEPEVVEEEIKNYQKLDRSVAEELGKKLSADYVIWGSITVLGEVVSIDAQIMDLKGEKKPAQFFQEVKGLSEVIPQITRFARKSRLYIEGKEEDFYREDLSLAMAGPSYAPGRAHPERGYFGYAPYPVRPRTEEATVEKAKPRFGEDPLSEGGLLGNLVIDLSGNQPRVGFAKSEEEKGKGNQTQESPPYLYYYPPQPYYNYSPPPYYYYQKPPQEEGLFSKMKRWIWPFGEEESRPVYPQPLYPQPVPVPPQVSPQPQGLSQQIASPSQNAGALPTPQPVPRPFAPPSQPQVSPLPQPTPSQPASQPLPQGINNPWRWE